ncbi:hypothetical protein [Thiohalophilus thiocyanatoxydans]|uniref:Uncharacterized protein n=1 Tax=Thiohalophilus thiocyanatoxydans TaxID=381308 RepID=A0A4R8IP10_9GAMM|nr:hypothetical protein [Thiohalophilus thiocyanatoxydans]TDY02641.1 hypothetical protein EDC23_1016 [Thiohalophilus thiocyanatoxydans]
MKKLKLILSGIIIGLALGLWFGVNIGKGNPILSNPFDGPTLKQRLKDTTGDAVERAGREMEELGSGIKGNLEKD